MSTAVVGSSPKSMFYGTTTRRKYSESADPQHFHDADHHTMEIHDLVIDEVKSKVMEFKFTRKQKAEEK